MIKNVKEIEGEAFCQESEDVERVREAFELLFPKRFSKLSSAHGLFGTKIIIFRADIKNKPARETTEKIISMISENDKKEILNSLKNRLDETGNIYLRFNKQKAYQEKKLFLTSQDTDSIQVVIRVETHPATKENYLKTAGSLFS